jgi:hypothetical protein
VRLSGGRGAELELCVQLLEEEKAFCTLMAAAPAVISSCFDLAQ